MENFETIPYADLSDEKTWSILGSGSFGKVYLGVYLGLEIAIKEVLPSTEYDVQKYYKRETDILKACRHPNIVQYLGLCVAPTEKDGIPRILIISEFIDGGNLRSYIWHKEKPFPWRLRVSIAIDIARALAYLHSRNCLHRDLKGENCLITSNERCKLTDFGFARLEGISDLEKRRKTTCGTDANMAPELIVGSLFDIGIDIYSLGIIFAEIVSRRLVDANTFARLIPSFGIDHDEIKELASPGCPKSFINLTIACTQTDPANRPVIREVLESLKLIEGEIFKMEAAEIGNHTLSVGSIGYAGIKNGKNRPKAPRLPSFGISASVIDPPVGNGTITPTKAKTIETLEAEEKEDEPFQYSTSVVRNSILTVKPVEDQRLSSSLPSLPLSWMKHVAERSDQTVPSNLDTLSITAMVHGPDSEEEDIPEEIFHSAIVIPSLNPGSQLHRFSLQKPGWRLFQTTGIDLYGNGKKHNGIRRMTSQTEDSGGLFNKSRCELCLKRFGMLKAYLECDDCGYRCHLGCSAAVDPHCAEEHATPPPLPTRSLPPLPTSSAASSRLNSSKLKKKRVI